MLTLFLMNFKGYSVLQAIHKNYPSIIKEVISSTDSSVQNDYYENIKQYCTINKINFYDRENINNLTWDYAIAIGWKWLIKNTQNLIIFHDSILPKYRGFNPLVTALINGDNEVGVTALFATEKADEGDIIAQEKFLIKYPIKIQYAIEQMAHAYEKLSLNISNLIYNNYVIKSKPQDN